MALRAVLIDLDGTLWDSFPRYATILADLSGVDVANINERLSNGGNVVHLVRTLRVNRQTFFRECERRADETWLYPGAKDSLAELRKRGTPLGVVTNLPGQLARNIAGSIGVLSCFEAFETAQHGRRAKPDPACVFAALQTMNIQPTNGVVLVGDSPNDAGAALNAGISFVWARYGYGQLKDEQRLAEIGGFDEILRV